MNIKIKPNRYYREEFKFNIYYIQTDNKYLYDIGVYNKVENVGRRYDKKIFCSIKEYNSIISTRCITELSEENIMLDMMVEFL